MRRAFVLLLLTTGCRCGLGVVDDCGGKLCDGGMQDDGGRTIGCPGTLIFQSSTFETGTAPISIASGDLDRDGRADLVIVHHLADTAVVMRGNGDGTFRVATTLTTGLKPTSAVLADLDADEILDLAVANSDSDSLSIFLGVGDLTFKPPARIPAGRRPRFLVAADLDHAGQLDLAAANFIGGDLSVMMASDDGGYQPLVSLKPPVDRPTTLTAADFDRDGWLDLAVGGYIANGVTVFFSRGGGLFAGPKTYGTVGEVEAVVAGDFDSDGVVDLACGNNSVFVMSGRADGGFDRARSVSTNGSALLARDFDGDGRVDLITFSGGQGTVLHNDGQGNFSPQATPRAGFEPHHITTADFDGDSTLDLAVANFNDNTVTVMLRIGCGP